MAKCDKPPTHAGNIKRPLIHVVIGWVKIVWEHNPVEIVHKSYLKCGISNKIDGTKDFLGEGVAETEDVVDTDS